MKNKKILIIISFILIALFIIMGKMLFDITKENSNNNVKLIEVKGFVASKKQDDIMIILEDNETNVNSLQIKNTGFEINDSVTLKIENRNNKIQMIECKKTYDESWILGNTVDNIQKIGQYTFDKNFYSKFKISSSNTSDNSLNYFVIPIKNEGKYIDTYSPEFFMNNVHTVYDTIGNLIFKEKNESISLNIEKPKNVQLICFNMVNENNNLNFTSDDENIKLEVNKQGVYYAIFKEDNENYFELVFNILFMEN